jgi:hypothetical protein
MKYKIILLAILSVFLCNISYGGAVLFTWEDEQGGLHITDERPPIGAKILEISPTNIKTNEEMQRQRLIDQINHQKIRQDSERENIKIQAAQARKIEADSLRTADKLLKQADELRTKKGNTLRRRRRYRRKLAKYEKRAQEMLMRAESAGKQAESLERQLDN